MKLLFLHGLPATGKLTIARALAQRTGFALFHNHLTVDLVMAVYPFGSPAFVRQREAIWLDVMKTAAEEKRSLVFTFSPDRTVTPTFPDRLRSAVTTAGGQIHFVGITCAWPTLLERVVAKSRTEFKKLSSPEFLQELKDQGAFDYPALPAELTIDSGQVTAAAAAERIIEHCGLPSV